MARFLVSAPAAPMHLSVLFERDLTRPRGDASLQVVHPHSASSRRAHSGCDGRAGSRAGATVAVSLRPRAPGSDRTIAGTAQPGWRLGRAESSSPRDD